MGYGGKTEEQQRARELRAQAWTLADIAAELGVSKGSVSIWTRDVEFTPRPRNRGNRVTKPHPLHLRKLAEIDAAERAGRDRFLTLSDDAFFAAGVALYVGEGSKTNDTVSLANTDEAVIRFFCTWLRRFFEVEESRLRCQLYLHQRRDLQAAIDYWHLATQIPKSQFTKPYRAAADPARSTARHPHGCLTVRYASASLHRQIIGLGKGLLYSKSLDPG